MNRSFEILQVEPERDDATIRKSYLAMVRKYPPERFPDEFQRIRAAYESIKTETDRLKTSLFDYSMPTMDDFIDAIQGDGSPGRPSEALLRQLLDESVTKTINSELTDNG